MFAVACCCLLHRQQRTETNRDTDNSSIETKRGYALLPSPLLLNKGGNADVPFMEVTLAKPCLSSAAGVAPWAATRPAKVRRAAADLKSMLIICMCMWWWVEWSGCVGRGRKYEEREDERVWTIEEFEGRVKNKRKERRKKSEHWWRKGSYLFKSVLERKVKVGLDGYFALFTLPIHFTASTELKYFVFSPILLLFLLPCYGDVCMYRWTVYALPRYLDDNPPHSLTLA